LEYCPNDLILNVARRQACKGDAVALTLFWSKKEQNEGTGSSKWAYFGLGASLIFAGIVVLGDVVAATVVSTMLLGLCAILAGIVEIGHSIWTKGWGGLIWHIILGCLYMAGGIALVTGPAAGSLIVTYVLGFVLAASGIVRIVIGLRSLTNSGGVLLLSGVFGILAGALILAQWPSDELSVIGIFLGLDLTFHGAGWVALALAAKSRS
jgi:uncharacterized membrane protein HdeD (DUF308 family)